MIDKDIRKLLDAQNRRLYQAAKERDRLRAALHAIAVCNEGKGYMPELARRALEGSQ